MKDLTGDIPTMEECSTSWSGIAYAFALLVVGVSWAVAFTKVSLFKIKCELASYEDGDSADETQSQEGTK